MASDSGSPLLALYRRYVGEPASERDVYVGFALFFGGIALGAVGLVVFLYSTGLEPATPFYWQLREIAISAAFLGLPAFILSVIVLLPVGRRARLAAVGGGVLCLLAVGAFIAVYPGNWNVQGATDYSAQGVALYAAGLAVLAGSTGSALVAQYLERARPTAVDAVDGESAASEAGGAGGGASGRRDADVTDEQVRRDIEESMERTDLSWGGVRKRETKRLKIRTPDVEAAEAEASGFDRNNAKTARSSGTDDAVAGLRQLQGGERKQAAGTGTDDQAEALKQLKAEREAAAEEPADRGGVLGQVRDRLGL